MYRGADSASSSSESIESHGSRERVFLHVYELGAGTRLAELIRGLNAVTKSGLGAGGVFHAAIEVENLSRGLEWSYGYSADGSGVFAIKAKQHPDHTYRETVVLGRTALNREQLLKRLRQMQSDWAGDEYHLVRCNCISYCKASLSHPNPNPIPPVAPSAAGVRCTTKPDRTPNPNPHLSPRPSRRRSRSSSACS